MTRIIDSTIFALCFTLSWNSSFPSCSALGNIRAANPQNTKPFPKEEKERKLSRKVSAVCSTVGPVENCAKYHAKRPSDCVACAEHYELTADNKCSPCVTCTGHYGTLDFCPLYYKTFGGVVPIDPFTGEMPLYPQNSKKACNKYVKWGYDGYKSKKTDEYYCRSDHHIIWVYNITVDQVATDEVMDNVKRQVIWTKSGDDDDFRIPTRPVYACEKDTIIVRTHNDFDPHHVKGDAWPPEGDNFEEMTMGLSIHWHGMWHLNNQFMDGVSMLTQCPIGNVRNNEIDCTSQQNDPNGNRFDYTFLADPDGTYWFHSHTGLQYGDGLFGPMIIFDRPEHNPYRDMYDFEIEPIIQGDWWHRLSQSLAVDLFYGASYDDGNFPIPDRADTYDDIDDFPVIGGDKCDGETGVKCLKAFDADSWESTFQCLCAGGSTDYPYVTGHLNGIGAYPEITPSSTGKQLKKSKFYEINFTPGKNYRLRIINGGFNFGYRFSIDDHLFSVIAVDGGYVKEIKDVSHFASMPGERYDIIFKGKTTTQLQELGKEQFFIRTMTYTDTSWAFSKEANAYYVVDDDVRHTVFGVLNYDRRQKGWSQRRKNKRWFGKNGNLKKDLINGYPLMEKVLDISMYQKDDEYSKEMTKPAVDGKNLIQALQNFRYEKDVKIRNCNAPVHSGKGPTGAPFGCKADGTPIKQIPKPDLLVHLWINGIMFPAYNLFLAKSEVMPFKKYTTDDSKWQESSGEKISYPNMFARPRIPLIFTRGKRGLRNLDVYGASKDSPGYDKSKNPPRGDYGSFMQQNFGHVDFDSGEAAFTDNTNHTQLIFLPKDKWVQVWLWDGGPMTHPFHLHGYDTWLLGRNREYCPMGDPSVSCGRNKDSGCSDTTVERKPVMFETDNPKCKKSMASYVNGYGASMIPPVNGRYQPSYPNYTAASANLNMVDPPRRDMTLVPPHGHVVFQFFTDNPGAWFYHCHLEFHAGLGMAVVWMVGADGDDFVNLDQTTQQIGARDDGNCGDVEFEGPIQFYREEEGN